MPRKSANSWGICDLTTKIFVNLYNTCIHVILFVQVVSKGATGNGLSLITGISPYFQTACGATDGHYPIKIGLVQAKTLPKKVNMKIR